MANKITYKNESTNPSSSEIRRLTQYLAFQATMYCKVPVLDIIFVMQAG
jgi:hypothetical protein